MTKLQANKLFIKTTREFIKTPSEQSIDQSYLGAEGYLLLSHVEAGRWDRLWSAEGGLDEHRVRRA